MGITINCKEATLLLEKKHDMPVGVKENIQLFYHLTICKACSLYQKQSKFLEKALRRSLEMGEENKNLDELKQKIKDLLIKS